MKSIQHTISSYKLKAAVLLCCTALIAFSFLALAEDGKKTTRVIPPNIEAFGTSYSELAGAWWSWIFSQPTDKNPILDETGAFCQVGQDEDFGQGKKIFFLAGTFVYPPETNAVVRECTVPAGRVKALFFPLSNRFFVTPEEGTLEEVRALSNQDVNKTFFLECLIDGVPVEDLFAYRAQSPPGGSPFEIREGSFGADFFAPRGPAPAVSDGYWLLVELGPGKEHIIEFRAKIENDPTPEFPYDYAQVWVIYNLSIEDGGQR